APPGGVAPGAAARAGAPAGAASGAVSNAGGGDPVVTPLAAEVLRAPWEPEPHRALGRALLWRDRPREATFELSAAFGMSHDSADLAWLARGYEGMGAIDEALAAYQRTLQLGLRGALYDTTRARFVGLVRQAGPALDRSPGGP